MTETKNVGGRPPHEPTDADRKQVKMLAGFGNTEEQIGLVLGITPPTLRKHYEHELAVGHIEANNAVKANLFRLATATVKDKNGNVTADGRAIQAMIFWLRCRAGWSEYAPPPVDKPKEQTLGKKEQQALDAANAGSGSEWGHLVN